jgi:PAS domain-containing protein
LIAYLFLQNQRNTKESQQRLKDFATSAADRFWETYENHRFTYISELPPGSYRISGKDFLGKTRWDTNPARVNEIDWTEHRGDMEAHRPFKDFRYSYVFQDGKTSYINISGIPVFAEDGTFKGYRGSTQNRTQEVLAKENAATIQRQFFEAFENVSDGVVLWGLMKD